MINPKFVFVALILFSINKLSSQNLTQNQEKISNSVIEYFKFERENIYLHFNKNSYLTNEKVWIKGYIINQQTKLPFASSNNIYISLYDNLGKMIKTNLYFSENGFFESKFNLDKTLETGKYFFRVYTNYMNNFAEDLSSVYEIDIINPVGKAYYDHSNVNLETINISFFPESGIFLDGVTNTIAVKIVDCNANGIEVKNAEIQDSNGLVVTTFSTTRFGYGKFDVIATSSQSYVAKLKINDQLIEKKLPEISLAGIAFSVNDFSLPEKTLIKLKTNSKTYKTKQNLTQTIVIQKNDNLNFVDFLFEPDHLEKELILRNDSFFEGVNTIYLLDEIGKKVGERMVYKPKKTIQKTDIIISQKRNDSIVFLASTPLVNWNISISVLPSETISETPKKTILDSFEFDNYLTNPIANSNYYLSECNRTKWFELDNIFITQKSKYDWNTIIQKPTERKFDFEHGLTIKGIVNSDLKDPSSAKVNMTSITSQINEVSGLNLKKEFLFENVLAVDSTKIYFAVLDKNNKKMEQKTYSQLVTDFNKFMKPFVPTIDCDYATNTISNNKFSLPKFQKAILLDSVAILTKKNKLNYDSRNGNNNGRGFKITEKDEMSYRDVLRFIASNGYNVSLAGGDVTINGYNNNNFNNRTVRNRNSFFKMGGPAIFIDNLIIQDYNTLQDYSMSNIDEIYLNKNNDVSSMLGYQGTIKIYTKKNTTSSASTSKSEFLLVHNGFQSYKKYLNPKYENYIDDGFLKMGTINWVSNISVNDKGSFYFSIPNLNQKEVKIIIQGIGNDGQIISEIKSVAIP